jgi:hypothetical protein
VSAPSVTVPESLIRPSQSGYPLRWTLDKRQCLSPDRPDDTVLVPESFRGGCSVGAETKTLRLDLSRIVVMDVA